MISFSQNDIIFHGNDIILKWYFIEFQDHFIISFKWYHLNDKWSWNLISFYHLSFYHFHWILSTSIVKGTWKLIKPNHHHHLLHGPHTTSTRPHHCYTDAAEVAGTEHASGGRFLIVRCVGRRRGYRIHPPVCSMPLGNALRCGASPSDIT